MNRVAVLTDADRALLGKYTDALTTAVEKIKQTTTAAHVELLKDIESAVRFYWLNTEGAGERALAQVEKLLDAKNFQKILAKLATVQPIAALAPARAAVSRPAARPAAPPRASSPTSPPGNRDTHVGTLPPGEHATLTAALQYPDGLDRKRLGILTGYKRSSRDAYIARLSQKGLVTTNGTLLFPTEDGRAAMNGLFEPLPTGDALVDYWRAKLPDGERRSLEVLLAAGGADVEREAIDTATGYKRSSRDAYLTRLKARGLVEFSGRGMVRASEELFS